jgi:hypothetical protein
MAGPSQFAGTRSRHAYTAAGQCLLGFWINRAGLSNCAIFWAVPRSRPSLNLLRQMYRGGDGPRQGQLILSNSTFPQLPAASPSSVGVQKTQAALPWNHGMFVCTSRSDDSEAFLPPVPRGRRRLCGARFQVVQSSEGHSRQTHGAMERSSWLSDQLLPAI